MEQISLSICTQWKQLWADNIYSQLIFKSSLILVFISKQSLLIKAFVDLKLTDFLMQELLSYIFYTEKK